MADLLSCPFCGGDPVLAEQEPHAHSALLKALVPDIPDYPGSWSIECCDVGMIKATRDEVVAAWNRRAPPQLGADIVTFNMKYEG